MDQATDAIRALFWSGWGVELPGVDKEHPVVLRLAELREWVAEGHAQPDDRPDDLTRHLPVGHRDVATPGSTPADQQAP